MKEKILIVEDEFIVANDLRIMLVKAGYEVCGIAASVEEAKGLIAKNKPSWVLLDIILQDGSVGIDLAAYLNEIGGAFIYISANTNQSILEKAKATQPYGFVIKPFREKDLLIMLDIAREKHEKNLQFNRQRELMLLKQLELITNSPLGSDEKWNRIPSVFQTIIPFDQMRICIGKKRGKEFESVSFIRSGFDEYQILKNKEFGVNLGLSARDANCFAADIANRVTPNIYNKTDYKQLLLENCDEKLLHTKYRLESKLLFPLELVQSVPATISFYSCKADLYSKAHINLLHRAAKLLIQLLESFDQVKSDWEPDGTGIMPKLNLRCESVKKESIRFEGIIGNSPALLNVLDQISLVAPTQSSVLILGDSGTGKERIAQCIHQLSSRKSGPMITVNCAALPKELIESELFGHEKGAFTGALGKRPGKFELANGGTIFLDEIGELPLDAQVKLLRVFQEKEFEPIGGSRSVKVDVRFVAATNRKLEKEVAEGRFRLDLYYRINVFPIEVPPLRERKGDIFLLTNYFIEKFCREMDKTRPSLSQAAFKQLDEHNWPGNIRELEHLLERTLIMTNGPLITHFNLPGTSAKTDIVPDCYSALKTLEEIQTEHILNVLKSCKGKIFGVGGAAEILGLKASTLNSKIKKLGIRKEAYFNK